MKLVICDDNIEEIKKLQISLRNIFQQQDSKLELKVFTSGKKCYDYLSENYADIVFFDIYLKDGLGVDWAIKLRQQGLKFKLIFLTTSNEFANESYEAEATYYLLKPASDEKITQALLRCNAFEKEELITLDTGKHELTLNPKKIIAVEVKDKYCYIYTTQGEYKEYCPISKIREQLQQDYFLLAHRSYLINMNFVEKVEDGYFLMSNGFKAQMRVRDANAIRNQYMQWLLDNN